MARLREEMQAGDRLASPGRLHRPAVADHARRLDALEQELQAFRSEYNVSMEKVKGMLKFDVPVHFEFASSELREADRPVLDRFASVVKELPRRPRDRRRLHRSRGERGLQPAPRPAPGRRGQGISGHRRGVHQRDAQGGELRRGAEPAGVPGPRARATTGIENRRVALVIDHSAIRRQVAMP